MTVQLPNVWSVSVAGVTFEGRQAVLAELSRTQAKGEELACELVREPDNPHDANAIKVLLNGKHVGYIPRLLAVSFAVWMDVGNAVEVLHAFVVSGNDGYSVTYGVRLEVTVPLKDQKEA